MRRPPPAGALAGGAAALLVLGPLWFAGGFALSYDMVFVPHPVWRRDLVGVGSTVARAVPSDLVVAALSTLLPGEIVQRLILAAVLVLAGWGAGRLVPGPRVAQFAAAATYVWTAGVGERLVLGQWAFLVSYAALPWVAAAALRGGPVLVLAMAGAALGSPAGTLLAGLVAVSIAGTRGARAAAAALGATALVSIPWALPSLLRPTGVPADPAGLRLFAPAADTPLGTAWSLLTHGGIWSSSVVPPGRNAWLPMPVLAVLLCVGVAGVWAQRRRPLVRGLVVAAVVGLVLATAALLPGVRSAYQAAVDHVQGAALFRDGQRAAAPWTLLMAVGTGAAVSRLQRRARTRALAVLVAVAPVAALPSLVWGVSGQLHPVSYPPDWAAVREAVRSDPHPGAVVALPWALYRQPAWNSDRVVLDPAPRWLPRDVVVDGDVLVGQQIVRGEDPGATAVGAVVSGSGPLVAGLEHAGIRWVLVERGEPGAEQLTRRLTGAVRIYSGDALELWRVPGPAAGHPAEPPLVPVLAADIAVALSVAVAGVSLFRCARRRNV